MKNVLLVASECVPFIKTGGLADVVGELPKYIDKTRYDVRVILPNYKAIPGNLKEQMKYHTHFYMDLGWRRQYVGILDAELFLCGHIGFFLEDGHFDFSFCYWTR